MNPRKQDDSIETDEYIDPKVSWLTKLLYTLFYMAVKNTKTQINHYGDDKLTFHDQRGNNKMQLVFRKVVTLQNVMNTMGTLTVESVSDDENKQQFAIPD